LPAAALNIKTYFSNQQRTKSLLSLSLRVEKYYGAQHPADQTASTEKLSFLKSSRDLLALTIDINYMHAAANNNIDVAVSSLLDVIRSHWISRTETLHPRMIISGCASLLLN
jgi:hypothetical protein